MKNLKQNEKSTLLDKIKELNYERICALMNLKGLTLDYSANVKKIENLKIEIKEFDNKLSLLVAKLNSMRCKYLVQFQGFISDYKENKTPDNPMSEEFYCWNCYEVDTIKNGWAKYVTQNEFIELQLELHELILHLRYSEFQILNIKKL